MRKGLNPGLKLTFDEKEAMAQIPSEMRWLARVPVAKNTVELNKIRNDVKQYLAVGENEQDFKNKATEAGGISIEEAKKQYFQNLSDSDLWVDCRNRLVRGETLPQEEQSALIKSGHTVEEFKKIVATYNASFRDETNKLIYGQLMLGHKLSDQDEATVKATGMTDEEFKESMHQELESLAQTQAEQSPQEGDDSQ